MSKHTCCLVLAMALVLLASSTVACAKPAPAEFSLTSLYIVPKEVVAGEATTVSAQVENIGGTEGTYAVILTVDGVTVEAKDVTITPGSSTVVTFSLVKEAPGTYEISVGNLRLTLIVKEKPVPAVKEVELKYDDGTSDGIASCGRACGFLVHFSPPVTPFAINEVKIFTNLSGAGYEEQEPKVEIWDKGFALLHYWQEPATRFSKEPDWMTVDIPDITVTDDFYIVFYTNSKPYEGVYIHYDSSVVNEHSEMAADGKLIDWIWERIPKEKANWMIRVVGIPADAGTPVTSPPSQTTETSADFQETVSLLNTLQKLSQWMINNIKYESHYEIYKETGVQYIASPEETFNSRAGCCAEFAVFAHYVLGCHGYDAKILRIVVESNPSKNHVVCAYESSGSLYTINVGRIEGPYQTYEDIAFNHDKDWSQYDIHYSWMNYQQLGRPDEVVYRE